MYGLAPCGNPVEKNIVDPWRLSVAIVSNFFDKKSPSRTHKLPSNDMLALLPGDDACAYRVTCRQIVEP